MDFGEESLTSCSKSKEEMATHMLAVFVRGDIDCYAIIAVDCALLILFVHGDNLCTTIHDFSTSKCFSV